ncbi:hypothetical protein [Aneurinibacillus terranovensis]|uniref:hypothetical protein n=1 Tax=Aneurinibacillus terranovensis TaxID=278991 RepID=UPI000415823D|nr:hypothetical protein [Aneurinibacillus terranovensis]
MNIYDGTHMWIWQADKIHGGNVQQMIAEAKARGIHGVLIKFANGSLVGDPNSQAYMAQFKRLVGPFKAAGIIVGGWIYQYLTDVAGEVDACCQAIEAGADWIVLDAEIDVKGKASRVAQFGQMLRAKHPNVLIGLSSFAIADYHPEVPFTEYNKFVDVMMPQIYWAEMGWNVAVAFNASIASYKKYGKPIAPSGQAYAGAQPGDMAAFIQLSKKAGLSHVSWWDWQQATLAQLNAIQANILARPKPAAPNQTEDWRVTAIAQAKANKVFKDDHKPGEPVTIEILAATMNNFYDLIKGGK